MSGNGFINLNNQLAECKIALWGGNIVSYRPKDEEHDIFWLGDLNKFDNMQAIRGGVPVCWPRVAEEKLNDSLPRHGFARISGWNLQKIDGSELSGWIWSSSEYAYDRAWVVGARGGNVYDGSKYAGLYVRCVLAF